MLKDWSHLYPFPFFIAALCIFIVSQYALTRHKSKGAWYLILVCWAASFWALTEGLLYLDLNPNMKVMITKCQYFGIVQVPPLTLLFVLASFGYHPKIRESLRWVLIAIMSIIIILVWTNPLHRLFFTSYTNIETGTVTMLGLVHGPMWWAAIAYHYSLVAVITFHLIINSFTASGSKRPQAQLILVAVASVWAANLIYISGHSPVPNMDISPIAFTLVAGAMAWGFFRHNLLDIIPVAQTEVFHGMEDAVLVFDKKNRIVDFNKAAESIIQPELYKSYENLTQKLYGEFPVLQRIIENMRSNEIPLFVDGQENIYDVRVSNLFGQDRQIIGRIMALRDITARKRAIEAIMESEEKFKFLTENMADIVWTLDMNFNVTYVSPSVEKVLGFTPEMEKQLKMADMVTPKSMQKLEDLFSKAFQTHNDGDTPPGKPVTIELEYYHQDDTIIWMESSVKALRDDSGRVNGFYGVSRDITERRQAEEALLSEKNKLQEAIAQIKILSGMLPICSSCKKIRDDNGYWNQIESYIQEHSEVDFSHSICPECAGKYYGDYNIYKS